VSATLAMAALGVLSGAAVLLAAVVWQTATLLTRAWFGRTWMRPNQSALG